MDKAALVRELIERLTAELDTLRAAVASAHEAATHEEARAENQYDTRGLEASYLARGQAERLEALERAVVRISRLEVRTFGDQNPISVGALVSLDDGEGADVYLLAPEGGGERLAGGKVRVITPSAPLGKALVGKRVGDEVSFSAKRITREFEVTEVV